MYSSCGLKSLLEMTKFDNVPEIPLNILMYNNTDFWKNYDYSKFPKNFNFKKFIIDIGIDDKATPDWKTNLEQIIKSYKINNSEYNLKINLHSGGHQFSNDFFFEEAIKFIYNE